MKDKIGSLLNKLKIIFFCGCIVLFQEIFTALLPDIVLIVICMFPNAKWPYTTLYNNLFVGYATLSVGNIIYLRSKSESDDEDFETFLMWLSIIALIISLAATTCMALGDMGYMKISLNVNYLRISLILFIMILVVIILKICDKVKEKIR